MVKRKQINILFLVCFLLTLYIRCDLPVDCVKTKIQGEWVFRINKETFQPSLNNPKTTCTHGFPDQIDTTVGDKDYTFQNYKDIVVTLNADHKIYEEGLEVGIWTPVYNEGFIAIYKGSEFTAFSKYFKKEESRHMYASNCDKTMIGWYIPDTTKKMVDWSCFFGFKSKLKQNFNPNKALIQVGNSNFLKKKEENTNESIDEDTIEMFDKVDSSILLQTSTSSHMKYEEQHDLVNEINSSDLTWKAGLYDEFKGMSFAQVNQKMSGKARFRSTKSHKEQEQVMTVKSNTDVKSNNKLKSHTQSNSNVAREADSKDIKDQKEILKYQGKELNEINVDELPINWDWRNVGGVNYVPHPRNQGDCGSCYIFATVGSLEIQLRIQSLNQDKTLFSRQHPISCNFYTEGCKGGFPILVGKFFSEFEIIPETCFKYSADDNKCENRCDNSKNPKKHTVSKYGYIGGVYGAVTEELMMKELRAYGPIPGNILVPWQFSVYKSGILSTKKLPKNSGSVSKSAIIDNSVDWLKVEHSTLIVGYGVENGVKYWICMNTWGEKWGEGGFYRILRGENECNVESMGEFFRLKTEAR